MKILRLIHSLDAAKGGPITSVRTSSIELKKMGHRVLVACLDGSDEPWASEFPVACRSLGPGFGSYGYTRRLSDWLVKHVRSFDAVIVHGLWQHHGLAASRMCRAFCVPYFVFPHGMLDPWFKRRYPLKHLKKSLYWRWAEYRVLRDAEAVLFTSEEERLRARDSFRPYRCHEKVVNYGSAAPTGDSAEQRAGFLEQFPNLKGMRIILFLGRLHEKKGVDILIRAWERVKKAEVESRNVEYEKVHLVIAGPGDKEKYGRKMMGLAADLDVADSITWTGMLEGDLKWGAFHSADAFILPSHQENFGIAVVEALAAGTPVLISNKVNIWREIERDGAGLVDDDTVEGSARLIDRWIERSGSDRVEIGIRARDCFRSCFDVHRAAESLVSEIEEGISRFGN